MKNRIKILIFAFFICISGYSQEENNSNYSSNVFNSNQDGLNLLSNINLRQLSLDANNNGVLYQQNNVVIQQVGFNNTLYSSTVSESSNLELYQKGDFNDINLTVNAPSVTANILQNGNNNRVLDNVYYSNLDVGLQAIQNGDNLTINRIGVNSLSNKLQLIQEGSYKTITVISN